MFEQGLKNSYLLRLTVILICLTLMVFICAKLQMIIVPLIFSLIFSVMLYPLVRKLESWKVPRGIAAFTSILVATAVLGVLLYFLTTQTRQLLKQGPELAEKVDGLVEELQFFIWDKFGITETTQSEKFEHQLTRIEEDGAKIATVVISAIAKFFTDVVLIPLFVFFLLYYRKFFMDFFYRAFQSIENKLIDNVIQQMHIAIQSWLVGVVLVMLIVGTLNTIGLLILGIPYAAFFGFLAAFLLIFPFIGMFIGSLLPVVMALITKDSYWYAVGVVGVFWFIQILEANIITPNIVGSKISINPLVAIIVLLLFGNLWGISGLILALPLTAICKIVLDAIPETQAFGFILGEPARHHLSAKPGFKFKFKSTKVSAREPVKHEVIKKAVE